MNAIAAKFKETARRITRDLEHRNLIAGALGKYYPGRDEKKNRFQDWQQARQAAAEIKYEAINHLDSYLEQFVSQLEARGTKVFWASTAEQARDYIADVARKNKVRSIVKSKAMTGEEVHLSEALEKDGYKVVETDLGEFIVQLRQEPPYHIVFPAMHLSRYQISDLFEKKLGSAKTDSPEELTMIARRELRKKYCEADMGISGANFAIAETGMISLTTNEGNGRLCTSLPRIHVALLGIEKVLPTLDDLALFLPMLATMGAAQQLTCYNTMIGGARQRGETDGPTEFHVVLLDNGRTSLMADAEQRDALHCIRCGACLNVCPIFKNLGGHTYATTYPGPIGSVITPHLRGLLEWKHLSFASSLCGACTETCPIKIDLHHHLLQNRRNATVRKPLWWEKPLWKGFVFLMNAAPLYRLGVKFGWFGQKFHGLIKATPLDPAGAWTESRELPGIALHTFKDYWAGRRHDPPVYERPEPEEPEDETPAQSVKSAAKPAPVAAAAKPAAVAARAPVPAKPVVAPSVKPAATPLQPSAIAAPAAGKPAAAPAQPSMTTKPATVAPNATATPAKPAAVSVQLSATAVPAAAKPAVAPAQPSVTTKPATVTPSAIATPAKPTAAPVQPSATAAPTAATPAAAPAQPAAPALPAPSVKPAVTATPVPSQPAAKAAVATSQPNPAPGTQPAARVDKGNKS